MSIARAAFCNGSGRSTGYDTSGNGTGADVDASNTDTQTGVASPGSLDDFCAAKSVASPTGFEPVFWP
jgi:hypothetical protein